PSVCRRLAVGAAFEITGDVTDDHRRTPARRFNAALRSRCCGREAGTRILVRARYDIGTRPARVTCVERRSSPGGRAEPWWCPQHPPCASATLATWRVERAGRSRGVAGVPVGGVGVIPG